VPGREITLTVDGTEHSLSVLPHRRVVHLLTDDLGYTGPEMGCQNATCGECTVEIDGEAVKSCTVSAGRIDGSEIETLPNSGAD
jgi:carbon-monoxide dehydrogenase small subunit